MMVLGPRGRALIQSFERLALEAYPDSGGVPTIGWGHTRGVKLGDRCTVSDAADWFFADTQDAVNAVIRSLDIPVSQCQFDALVAFTFNVGEHAEAHSTLINLVNGRHFEAAADEFAKWNHVNGKPLLGLTRRRAAERVLFVSTEDQPPAP
jgi:lysozyme